MWKLLQFFSPYVAHFVMPRRHGQREDHLVLDEPRDVHVPGRKHAVDLVVGFRDLARALRELQFGVDRNGNLDRIEAALAEQLNRSPGGKPQTWLAAARASSAQVILQPFGRALQLCQARQPLHAHHAPPFLP
jgi:hypothetical protein